MVYNRCICCGKHMIQAPNYVCWECKESQYVNLDVLHDILYDHHLCSEQRKQLLLAIDILGGNKYVKTQIFKNH